jgi:hypothetical protein
VQGPGGKKTENVLLVADARLGADATSQLLVDPSILRSVKIALPFRADTVVVPRSVPVPADSVIDVVAAGSRLAPASVMLTETGGIGMPAVTDPIAASKRNTTGGPTVMLNARLTELSSPSAFATSL